jgi:hypothetical protein
MNLTQRSACFGRTKEKERSIARDRDVRDNHYNRRRAGDVDKVIWVDPTACYMQGIGDDADFNWRSPRCMPAVRVISLRLMYDGNRFSASCSAVLPQESETTRLLGSHADKV